MFRKVLRICWIAGIWTLAWGIAGAAIGGVVTVFQPDTGHIPANMVPILIGVPNAAFGLVTGLIYGTVKSLRRE